LKNLLILPLKKFICFLIELLGCFWAGIFRKPQKKKAAKKRRKTIKFARRQMTRKRFIFIDPKIEQAITTVCDAALKFAGMQMAETVAEISSAIREKTKSNLDEEEDWLD
jgi:hypothetical protein